MLAVPLWTEQPLDVLERDWKEGLPSCSASSPCEEVDWARGISAMKEGWRWRHVRWRQTGDTIPSTKRGFQGPQGEHSRGMMTVALVSLSMPLLELIEGTDLGLAPSGPVRRVN